MIFDFLKKQKKSNEKLMLIKVAFLNMQISEEQKALYIGALDILDDKGVDRLYDLITRFTREIEINELQEIQKSNFSVISGLKKKEAEEKKKDINSFSFLINNI